MNGDASDGILRATHRALRKRGYADLTLKHSAAETGRSTATIHYYYGSKASLITAFLEFFCGEYTDRIESVTGGCQRNRRRSLLDELLANDDGPNREFRTAMLEVRARAPYDDGEFVESADPDLTAEFLTTAIGGTQTRHVALGQPANRLENAIRSHVETHLVAEPLEVAR